MLTLIAVTLTAGTLLCSLFSMNVPNAHYNDTDQSWWNYVAWSCLCVGFVPIVPLSLWLWQFAD